MAKVQNSPLLSIIVAKDKERLSDFAIADKQLIFVENQHTVALDYNGKRTFFNQIQSLKTEKERQELESPINGLFYFVSETGTLYTYENAWITLTSASSATTYIGIDKPEVGAEGALYVDRTEKNIAVWDNETGEYVIVAETSDSIDIKHIEELFKEEA